MIYFDIPTRLRALNLKLGIMMNTIQTKKIPGGWLISGLIGASLLLGACGQPQAEIALVEPVTNRAEYDSYEIKNCAGSLADLHESMAERFKVKQAVIIADQATTVASGAAYPISEAEKEMLAEQVKEAYQQKYTAAQAGLEKLEFVAPQDRIATFDITWSEQVYKSTLIYKLNGEAQRVEYEYTLTVPEMGERVLHICGG